jgi:hypothetical protein
LIHSQWLSPCVAGSVAKVRPPSIDLRIGAFITYTTSAFCGSAVIFM